jgi:uncharacterized protein
MSSKMGRREFIGTAAVAALALPAILKGTERSGEAADAKKSGVRVIAVEEHVGTPQLSAALKAAGINARETAPALAGRLNDLGAKRLADMDAAGIDMQVLSVAGDGLERLDRNAGIAVARDINDMLADAVKSYPARFAAFAVLPLQAPDAAAAELERCVTKVGFKGALISGTINGRFLDNPAFQPVFAAAEQLDVPIYLHPAPPPPAVYQAYFGDLPAPLAESLSTSAWGWHVETGMHTLRLVVSGLFDRFPKLQVIIGHMGENLPFSMARADGRLAGLNPNLKKRVAEYFRTNVYITTSAYFTAPPLLCALEIFGADRMLFAVDYPFSSNLEGRKMLDTAPISPNDLAKITHKNSERLLKL